MKPARMLLAGAVALALVVTLAPGEAAAGTGTYPRRDAPFVLRTEANVLFFSLANTDGFVGVTAGYSIVQWFALEATGGVGVGNAVRGDTGTHLMLLARLAGSVSDNHRHALTVGAGPLVVTGGGYGTMTLAHGEAGYEYRRAGGFTLLLAAGLSILLNDSTVPQPEGACSSYCPTQLHAFAPATHVRAGIGFSF